MPKIRPSGERVVIPQGEHVLTLKEVKPYDSEDKYHPNVDEAGIPDGTFPIKHQLIWSFESDDLNDDGVPYEYAQFTGQFYGDSRANLTALLDFLLPEEPEEIKKSIDTDMLIGRRFKARIQMVKNQAGKVVPKALYFEPLPAEPAFDPDAVKLPV